MLQQVAAKPVVRPERGERDLYPPANVVRRARLIRTFDCFLLVDDFVMKKSLDAVTEIDFVTCGLKPRGELLVYASKALEDFDSLVKSDQIEDFPLEAACRLVRAYVKCQEVIFNPSRDHIKAWVAKRLICTFMNACLQRYLPKAIEFRDQIEHKANGLEVYAVALGIIREYETYCSHMTEIDKHVEAQRNIVNSNRKAFLIALEKRDGLSCKGCGTVENLRIDHETPLSLGGFSTLENLQLLCNFCNGSKGNRPMEYLYKHMNKLRKPVIK